jgi:adenylate cyclase
MAENQLPDPIQKRFGVRTAGEMWRKILTEGNAAMVQKRGRYGRIPANPRCNHCHRPFGGIGGAYFRATQHLQKSDKNPRYCTGCYGFLAQTPGGAEIELTMLFADVRGSTALAEQMSAAEFGRLLNRFYDVTTHILIRADAFIDNLVGDEVTSLFVPGFAGPDHARKAMEAAQAVLRATGHGSAVRPWIPVGVGVHTGVAWVGTVGGAEGAAADFTALGDNVNITARLTQAARPGEILASAATCRAAGIDVSGQEQRTLALKGRREPVLVRVFNV